MKKLFAGVLTAALVLSIGAATAFAAGNGHHGRNFTDTDSSGVCGYAGTTRRCMDESNDGLCDYAGNTCRYTDADGDGLCDACGTAHGHGGQDREYGHHSAAAPQSQTGTRHGHGGHGVHHG